jgi:predicted nucleotide-binding protein
MGKPADTELAGRLIRALPKDGSPRLNSDLRNHLVWSVSTYLRIKDMLLEKGSIKKARGRGGAVVLAPRTRLQRKGRHAHKKSARQISTRLRVFVTHGHNDSLRTQVVDLLDRVDLDPVVLQDQANAGKTVIEKFEQYAQVAAAVVILSADDLGGKVGEDPKPRARQNVLLELGYFLGKLGRDRLVVLHDGAAEVPSDLSGLLTVRCSQDWKLPLLKELSKMVPIPGTLMALLDG